MVFSSPGFLFLFFPLFYALYFLLPRQWRNSYILIASLAFYSLGAGALTGVALLLLLANWLLAALIGRQRSLHPRRARALLGAGIAMNLLPLMFFKYLLFFAELLQDLTHLQLMAPVRALGIVLPLGISFYVFHFLSYLLDVHAGRIRHERSLQKFAIYIFLFPHLIAGPVVRYAEVREQLDLRYRLTVGRDVYWGLVIFAIGLAKKLLIADPLGGVVDGLYRPGAELSTLSAWLGALCSSFQIYVDFSGYTDMAIGMARMMGFRFPRNFNRPYAAATITEFWQRWHMTLSRFFRDYVYVPLGGNRHGAWRTYRNLFVVFVLCALWHGGAYTFALWGVGHGLLLVLERAGWLRLEKLRLGSLPAFVVVTLLWVPFRAPSLEQTGKVLGAMFGNAPLLLEHDRMLADPKLLFLLGLSVLVCLSRDGLFLRLRNLSFRPRMAPLLSAYSVALYIVACLAVVEGGFNPFIYFQF
jgi:alginate O-acetyltransferase complex protein AlgI